MGWFNLKNIGAIALAPFTAGASLALVDYNNKGDNLLGELTGANSARRQNEKQQNLQTKTNNQSIELANTAHQREVADLQAAGLNPVLSAGGSGAATPQLGTAQVQNEMPGGYLAQAAQVANIANTFSSAKQASSAAKLQNAQAEMQPELIQSEIDKNKAEASLAGTNALNAGTRTTAMENDEKFAKTWWGKNISPALRDIFGNGAGQTVVSSATSARNANKMANAIKKTPHTHRH